MSEAARDAEIKLIQSAIRGNTDAFGALYDRYYQAVYNFALWMCHDADLAEDLAQETFIRAFRKLGRLGPPWKIRPWLYRIARNLLVNQKRGQRLTQPLDTDAPLPSPEGDPERQLVQTELSGPVHSALQRLSDQYREALVLREVEGFHYQEIADMMGVSMDNVKVLLHRARASFKDTYGIRLLVEQPLPECDVLGELLDMLHDRELKQPEQDRMVREHLRTCERCQQRKRELAALLILFKAQPTFKPPAGRRGDMDAALKREGHRIRARRRWPLHTALGSAALVAVLAGWWFVFGPSDGTDRRGGGAEPAETPAPAPLISAPTPEPPACTPGDGICDAECENAVTAPEDCACNRNGVCDPGEHVYNCSADCGEPPPPSQDGGQPTAAPNACDKSCGNAACEPACGENPNNCPADCP